MSLFLSSIVHELQQIPFFQPTCAPSNAHERPIANVEPDHAFYQEVSRIQRVVHEWMAHMASCNWTSHADADTYFRQYSEHLCHISRVSHEMRSQEESKSLFHFLRSRFGFGAYRRATELLTNIQTEMQAEWLRYIRRCQEKAEEVLKTGSLIASFQMYRHLIRLAPNDEVIHERLGDMFMVLRQEDRAIGCYDTAMRLKPSAIQCHLKKMRCLLKLSRSHEASAMLQRLPQNEDQQNSDFKKQIAKDDIDTKIKGREFMAAIHNALQGIQAHPKDDEFKYKLVDAYLAFSEDTGADNTGVNNGGFHGKLFRKNFSLVANYFSQLSHYSQCSYTYADTLHIVLDLFDYAARQFCSIRDLMQSYITLSPIDERFIDIFTAHTEQKLQEIEKKKTDLEKSCVELRGKLSSHEPLDDDEVDLLRVHLGKCRDMLFGSRQEQVRVGLVSYAKFYHLALHKVRSRAPAHLRHKIRRALATANTLCHSIHRLCNDCIRSGERELSLTELFQRRLHRARPQQMHEASESLEGLEATVWIRRGNLMNFIRDYIVPYEKREGMLAFLEANGVDIEVLFATKILNMVPGHGVVPPHDLTELRAFCEQSALLNVAALSAYCHNPINATNYGS